MTKGNKNYRRGRAKEYRIMKALKKQGFEIVLRSAGSHSPIDVIAIKPEKIMFVQSKPNDFSKKKTKELLSKYYWLNNEFICKFEVI